MTRDNTQFEVAVNDDDTGLSVGGRYLALHGQSARQDTSQDGVEGSGELGLIVGLPIRRITLRAVERLAHTGVGHVLQVRE